MISNLHATGWLEKHSLTSAQMGENWRNSIRECVIIFRRENPDGNPDAREKFKDGQADTEKEKAITEDPEGISRSLSSPRALPSVDIIFRR
jgi:hypothetical protein